MIADLVPSKFADWLETLHPHTGMGEIGRCSTCPIAQYLKHLGYNFVMVGPWDCSVGPDAFNTTFHDLPSWAVTFIKRYDRTAIDTASEALRIIKEMRNA